LNALMAAPGTARNWRGPYLEKKALDPWKRSYQYRSPGVHDAAGFDLWSVGPDEQKAEDDINSWD
jgi:general secretion pathway protein G